MSAAKSNLTPITSGSQSSTALGKPRLVRPSKAVLSPARFQQTTKTSKISKNVGFADSLHLALKPGHRKLTAVGAVFGGMVPVATYTMSHLEIDWSNPWDIKVGIVLGGLLYSVSTVYALVRSILESRSKAVAFTVLLEGVMVTSSLVVLSMAALVLLVGINAVATGVALARGAKL